MKIIARHEKDDRDIELDEDGIMTLELELGCSVECIQLCQIVRFEMKDGWHYRIVDD